MSLSAKPTKKSVVTFLEHSAIDCHVVSAPRPGIAVGIQVLVRFKILPDTPQAHLNVEILMLLFGLNTGIWG